ncbi:MAG: hypothetical protein PHD21_08465, partial [Flavobacteriales bacterium]|nr:hypothetical protein [Flavobacteriales bacterium]
PTVRIDEAVDDGMDAISVTDHIEYRPFLKEYTNTSHNHTWDVVNDYGAKRGLIMIQGSEITRQLPPGHFNVLFVKDSDAFEKYSQQYKAEKAKKEGFTENIKETLKEARSQGAFIMWNHPSWPRGYSELFPIHVEMIKEGLIDAIEVVNGRKYSPEGFDWALQYGLAILGSTDAHIPMAAELVRVQQSHRSFTIVLAKEKTAQSIREALDSRRSVAVMNNGIYGAKENLDLLFETFITSSYDAKSGLLTLKNNTGFTFYIEKKAQGAKIGVKTTLSPMAKAVVEVTPAKKNTAIEKGATVSVTVTNAFINSKDNYTFTVKL